MKLSHEILLALAYVSQISDPESVRSRFIESLNGLDAAFTFEHVDHPPPGVPEYRVLPIATLRASFGYAVMTESPQAPDAERAVFRSAFQFLAILLENRMQARAQESRNVSLLKEINQEKSTVRTVLDTLPVGVWVTDEEGRILMGNTAGEKIWAGVRYIGIDQYGEYKAWLSDTGKRIEPEEWAIAHAIRTGKALIDQEVEIECFDGTRKTILNSAAPLLDDDRKVIGAVGVNQDITERKRAEEEKAKLQGQLLQSQKMESIGRLAGGVAHDFNNMLGIIQGHAEMALNQVDPAQPLFASLQEILKAAQRSADLTRQLLAFARKQTVAPKVLDLNGTVESMLSMLRRLIGEDIDLAWLPGKNLWPVKVDPSQIDQILANLCVNTRDAITGVGKVTIETGNAAFDEAYCAHHAGFIPGDYVLLAVSDNGCGMNRETLDNLFEPFFTTKETGKGTGLGLATVYGIVKQNNGFINVYSEPGKGSTFRIYLTRHKGQTELIQKAAPAESSARGHETILLVEDESAILKMTTMMLERQGYTVLAASTPGKAIFLAREHAGKIHLLMTDVVMPEMNGRDLAKKMHSLHPGLKCLFMSGYTANVIAHHGVLDEGVYFIQKPFSIKDLAAKVREAIDLKHSDF